MLRTPGGLPCADALRSYPASTFPEHQWAFTATGAPTERALVSDRSTQRVYKTQSRYERCRVGAIGTASEDKYRNIANVTLDIRAFSFHTLSSLHAITQSLRISWTCFHHEHCLESDPLCSVKLRAYDIDFASPLTSVYVVSKSAILRTVHCINEYSIPKSVNVQVPYGSS